MFANGGLGPFGQQGHAAPQALDGIPRPGAGAAGGAHHRHPLAPRDGPGDKQAAHNDGFVQVQCLVYAAALEECVIGLVPAGHRRRVGGCGAAAGLGLADLDGDDMLAALPGPKCGPEKTVGIADGLDVEKDHPGGIVRHHVFHVLRQIDIRLVAGGHHVAESQPRAPALLKQGVTDATALGNDRHPLFAQARRIVRPFGQGGTEGGRQINDGVVITLGVGSADPHAGAPGQLRDSVLDTGAFAPLLGKPRGDDHGVAHAGGGTALQFGEHHGGGNGNEHHIDGTAPVLDSGANVGKARQAVDGLVAGVDGQNIAPVTVACQEGQQPAPDLALIRGSADYGHGFGPEKVVQGMIDG